MDGFGHMLHGFTVKFGHMLQICFRKETVELVLRNGISLFDNLSIFDLCSGIAALTFIIKNEPTRSKDSIVKFVMQQLSWDQYEEHFVNAIKEDSVEKVLTVLRIHQRAQSNCSVPQYLRASSEAWLHCNARGIIFCKKNPQSIAI